MPRALKPYVVDKIVHTNRHDSLDLMFDRDAKVFFATLGMERVQSTDVAEATRLAKALLENAPRYHWEPIIIVDYVDSGERTKRRYGSRPERTIDTELHFSFRRAERCRNPKHDPKEERRHRLENAEWFIRKHQLEHDEDVAHYRKMSTDDPRGSWGQTADRIVEDRARNTELSVMWVDERSRVLPYSDDVWAGLCVIRDGIVNLRRSLAGLVARPRLSSLLRAASSSKLPPMLPAYPPPRRKE